MSDDDFQQADSGSSFTTPIQAGSVKKGGYVLLQGHPCKVKYFSYNK